MTRTSLFCWLLGALVLAWALGMFDGRKPTQSAVPNKQTDLPNEQVTEKTPVNVDRDLTQCLLLRARVGSYVSADVGSAWKLIKECADESDTWEDNCEKNGSGKDCQSGLVLLAQTAIKDVGKDFHFTCLDAASCQALDEELHPK
jgi:hypothetical protein